MLQALERIRELKAASERVSVDGNREYNAGWHTALDLHNLLTVSEIVTLAAMERKESRGAHFRDDFPTKDKQYDEIQHRGAKRSRWRNAAHARAHPAHARGSAANHRGDEVMATATFRIWRGKRGQGEFRDYTAEVSAGMVVLDAVHQIQAEQAGDLAVRWNCKAGKCGSCSAEINGMPKLMCMTRLNTLPLDKPVTVEPMKAFPHMKDLVTDVSWNYEVKKRIPKFQPRQARRGGWHLAHRAGRRRTSAGVSQVHRVLSLSGRVPRLARSSHARTIHRSAIPGLHGSAGDASVGRGRSR